VHTINDISTHPIFGTFVTGGSDGSFQFWDKESKTRLKDYRGAGGPISATGFNSDGSILTYAVSYDWGKGYMGNSLDYVNKIMMHLVNNDDCKPRRMTGTGRMGR